MGKYKLTASRPNGLPPLEVTWFGISRYRPSMRPGPKAHVVVISSEDSVEEWLIDDLELLPELMRMFVYMDIQVDSYSVLKPLPAFE